MMYLMFSLRKTQPSFITHQTQPVPFQQVAVTHSLISLHRHRRSSLALSHDSLRTHDEHSPSRSVAPFFSCMASTVVRQKQTLQRSFIMYVCPSQISLFSLFSIFAIPVFRCYRTGQVWLVQRNNERRTIAQLLTCLCWPCARYSAPPRG